MPKTQETIATSTLESTINTEDVKMENILKAFSPLYLLSDGQRKELGSRFNKTWIKPRMQRIDEIQREYTVDFFTACFTLNMLEDADNLILGKKIAKIADTMFNLSSELFGSEENKNAALLQIETAFDNLDAIHQNQAGKKFRKLVMGEFPSKMCVRILEMVTEKLGVREAEWV